MDLLKNYGRPSKKENLTEWVFLALERALTIINIMQGFNP
jgi:hypothetical protein